MCGLLGFMLQCESRSKIESLSFTTKLMKDTKVSDK